MRKSNILGGLEKIVFQIYPTSADHVVTNSLEFSLQGPNCYTTHHKVIKKTFQAIIKFNIHVLQLIKLSIYFVSMTLQAK